jgi:hypothetical protein
MEDRQVSPPEAYENYKIIRRLTVRPTVKKGWIWSKEVPVRREDSIKTSWLRTPGKNKNSSTCFGDASIGGSILSKKLSEYCYLRPAIWVKSSFFGDPEPQPLLVEEVASAPLRPQMTINEIMAPLNFLVGMEEFKIQVRDWIMQTKQDERDRVLGISSNKRLSHHIILTGTPGTGKTTVAQMLAQIFYNARIISQNKFIKVERADLVGKYIGHTEARVREKLQEAEGGVFFIDEAYSLVGSGNDFGRHVIDGLLTALTENKCLVVAAGYPGKIEEFLRANDGMERRFNHTVRLPDYSPEELFQIFKNLCKKSNLILENEEEIRRVLLIHFERIRSVRPNFGNAGYVENFFNDVKAIRSRMLSLDAPIEERKLMKVQYVIEAVRR